MSDLIDRQAAIDAFNTNIDELVVSGKENADAVERYLNRVIDEIKQLPPIQPRRGKWIPVTNGRGGHECDQCHEYAPSYQSGEEHLSDFCPHCGAKMEVTE